MATGTQSSASIVIFTSLPSIFLQYRRSADHQPRREHRNDGEQQDPEQA